MTYRTAGAYLVALNPHVVMVFKAEAQEAATMENHVVTFSSMSTYRSTLSDSIKGMEADPLHAMVVEDEISATIEEFMRESGTAFRWLGDEESAEF